MEENQNNNKKFATLFSAKNWGLVFLCVLSVNLFMYIISNFPFENFSVGKINSTEGLTALSILAKDSNQTIVSEESKTSNESIVTLTHLPEFIKTDQKVNFNFFVNDKYSLKPTVTQITENDGLLNVFGVKDDLSNFFRTYARPTDTKGVFSLTGAFQDAGLYKVWSDLSVRGEKRLFGHKEIAVYDNSNKMPEKIPPLVDYSKKILIGNYVVDLFRPDVITNKTVIRISLAVHDSSGLNVNLESFLGDEIHLVAIKDDLSVAIEASPDTLEQVENLQNMIPFKIIFPETGIYKVFAEFRPYASTLPKDESLVAEFFVKVENISPIYSLEREQTSEKEGGLKGIYVIGSIALILLISLGVKKYINH